MTISKKSLGQNFFINEHLGEKIVKEISKENPSSITEIGPGRGFFTRKLHTISPKITCIEKDDTLAKELSERDSSLIVHNEDFLNFDLSKLEKDTLFFGSLPYNISKPIIKKIISSKYFNNSCFFIIQKEVAEKYIATTPRNNLLSLITHLYAEPKRIFNINSGAFRPKPKVESSFIKFTPIKQQIEIPKNFEHFLIKCFRSPRKTLRNNLNTKTSDTLLQKRPSELTLNEYLILFKKNLI